MKPQVEEPKLKVEEPSSMLKVVSKDPEPKEPEPKKQLFEIKDSNTKDLKKSANPNNVNQKPPVKVVEPPKPPPKPRV